ncbi:Asparagine synthetase domain-containing protein 1 [Smittium mucronatum]|uniref:Asparagine synthetase domain-containing protein 1 n=1 Tax=Smittium mucronatum TaxID=133383 RepID=A0A1R0H474_9FUNG|nr:Asparagine synthetase domain-containing protein 1 [Smittium mucronatum]
MSNNLYQVLKKSVEVRVNSSPGAGLSILFSGGLDCMVLAALTHETLPIDQPIELINVSFENPRILTHSKSKFKKVNPLKMKSSDPENFDGSSDSRTKKFRVPDRVTGLDGLKELRSVFPNRSWNWIEVNVFYDRVLEMREHIVDLLGPNHTVMDLVDLHY